MRGNMKSVSLISQTSLMLDNVKPEKRECAVLMAPLSASSWKGAGGTKRGGGIILKFACGYTALYL
jgi:hypothetical protein